MLSLDSLTGRAAPTRTVSDTATRIFASVFKPLASNFSSHVLAGKVDWE